MGWTFSFFYSLRHIRCLKHLEKSYCVNTHVLHVMSSFPNGSESREVAAQVWMWSMSARASWHVQIVSEISSLRASNKADNELEGDRWASSQSKNARKIQNVMEVFSTAPRIPRVTKVTAVVRPHWTDQFSVHSIHTNWNRAWKCVYMKICHLLPFPHWKTGSDSAENDHKNAGWRGWQFCPSRLQ